MEKENEKVLASGPKGDETAAGENSNYGTELQKGGGRDELEEREEWRFKASPPLQTVVRSSPGTSGVTCVTSNLPGSPDAIQMPHPETHTGLFVCTT
ncbi:unnamed protein product [Pleuronectes platessa]|uniref:Uncharacterized protein n=1 Tax=Pleuronectes platessa TaxID=8262 RepID=A0A9N7V2Y6_PLEPL|nr:unnamed protein product [Pleuronectes platessa]